MQLKLIGSCGWSMLIKAYEGRWVILSECWGDKTVNHVYLPTCKTKIQSTGNVVWVYHNNKETYLCKCTLNSVPHWVDRIEMI